MFFSNSFASHSSSSLFLRNRNGNVKSQRRITKISDTNANSLWHLITKLGTPIIVRRNISWQGNFLKIGKRKLMKRNRNLHNLLEVILFEKKLTLKYILVNMWSRLLKYTILQNVGGEGNERRNRQGNGKKTNSKMFVYRNSVEVVPFWVCKFILLAGVRNVSGHPLEVDPLVLIKCLGEIVATTLNTTWWKAGP